MDAGSIPLLFLLILCFALSAFFAISEMALTAMNRIRIKNMADNGHSGAKRALAVANRFERALTTILIGNNIANIVSAALVTLLATRFWGSRALFWATLALTIFVFLFCEMLPKALAKRRSEDVAIMTMPALLFFMRVLAPIAWMFTRWSGFLKARFRSPIETSYTEEELAEIIETIEDEGVLEPEEQELVQSAFEFERKRAGDILIPIERVVSLPVTASVDEIKATLSRNKLSRFPVRDARNRRVIGLITANRFYKALIKGEYRGLRPLLLPIRSYNMNIPIRELMREMNVRRLHMALIKDENGRALGIVTMEDILEELVGEIYDEDDTPPEPGRDSPGEDGAPGMAPAPATEVASKAAASKADAACKEVGA